MTAWVDGHFVAPEDVPKGTAVAPFETMGAVGGVVALWERHLARLRAAAVRLGLPFAPGAALLAGAGELLRQNGHADDVLRLCLLPHGGTTHVVMTTRSRGPRRKSTLLLPTVVERLPIDPPGDLKAAPRRFYDAVLQQAQDGQADDGIVVGLDGAVLETAIANLWLRIDGRWVTPALDGRVLPGIARALLLERAAAAGLPVAERRCTFGDLERAEAIATSNAVHGPRAAQLLGSGPAAVAIVDSELGALWQDGAPGSSS